VVASCVRWFWKPWLVLLWAAVLAAFFTLMSGGVFGLTKVTTDQWGGLPLTVMLTVISMTIAFPIAVMVALGRRANMPAIRTLCVIYVELIRGVPLISVLFMASFMFPLFMPIGKSPDVLVRVIVGITLFAAAYMAEIVRGGLQSLSVVPSIMNNFISLFKDTSLVTIVSLYELTGALSLAVGSDPNWRPFKIEAYIFIAAIYFTCCFAMSRYSLWIERRLAVGKAR
jgi:general L-amino acid transport system permease protein